MPRDVQNCSQYILMGSGIAMLAYSFMQISLKVKVEFLNFVFVSFEFHGNKLIENLNNKTF